MAKTEISKTKKTSIDIGNAEDLNKHSQADLGAMLDEMNADESNEVTSEYLNLEPGEEARVWFIDTFETKKIGTLTNEMATTARFITGSGARAISQTAVIVSTVLGFKKPTPLLIQCTGENGPVGKRYKTFKIIELK